MKLKDKLCRKQSNKSKNHCTRQLYRSNTNFHWSTVTKKPNTIHIIDGFESLGLLTANVINIINNSK